MSLEGELALCIANMEQSRQQEQNELKKVTQYLGQITSCVNLCQQSMARKQVHAEGVDA